MSKNFLIADADDHPNIHDIPQFFRHLLERVDWRRDVHFQTETTIDTLDYSSTELNVGSKVVWACTGEPRRTLAKTPPMLENETVCAVVDAGILAVKLKSSEEYAEAPQEIEALISNLKGRVDVDAFPLIIACDDPEFLAADFNNFLWVRSRAQILHTISMG